MGLARGLARRSGLAAITAVLVALAALAAGGLAGCGARTPFPPTGEPVTPVGPTTAIPATEGTGLRAIRVERVDVDTGVVHFTDVQVFVDDEADRAAREDGAGGAPNHIWIRELGTPGSLVLDPAATVTLLGYDADGNRVPKPADVATFVRVYTAAAAPPEWEGAPWLFIGTRDGRIVSIEAVETP